VELLNNFQEDDTETCSEEEPVEEHSGDATPQSVCRGAEEHCESGRGQPQETETREAGC